MMAEQKYTEFQGAWLMAGGVLIGLMLGVVGTRSAHSTLGECRAEAYREHAQCYLRYTNGSVRTGCDTALESKMLACEAEREE